MVMLVLTAPEDVLPGGKMRVQAELDLTWIQFLQTDLQLRVTSDMYVCSAAYTVSCPPGAINSWRFELDDKIGDFLAKFKKKLTKYAVHIRRRIGNVRGLPTSAARGVQRFSRYRSGQLRTATRAPSVTDSIYRRHLRGSPAQSTRSALRQLKCREQLQNRASTAAQQTSSVANSGSQRASQPSSSTTLTVGIPSGTSLDQVIPEADAGEPADEPQNDGNQQQIRIVDVRSLMPPPLPPPARRQVPIPMPRRNNASNNDEAPGFSGATGNCNRANQQVALYTRRGAELNGVDDASSVISVMTSASAEERELRIQGIEPEDIRARVEERVSLFPNSFMLRMRHEVSTLRRSGRWLNTVEHTPLTCYFLQEILKQG